MTAQDSGLSAEELSAQDTVALPDREAMSLLDLSADLDLNLDIAAPIDAAVAANANVAAPIDAAVGANVISFNSEALASAPQDSIISQSLTGEATATAVQDALVDQADAGA